MRRPAPPVEAAEQGRERGRLRREVLTLVGLVIAVHALFVAGYFLAGMGQRPDQVRLAYTGAWTLATLLVVLRGLTRIRAERVRRVRAPRP